jgi:hypothetical protein
VKVCPTCKRKLAENAPICPGCGHDFVADKIKKAAETGRAIVLLAVVLGLLGLVLLSPGVIINTIRGRYKHRSRSFLVTAITDWQTWIISLPLSIPAIFMLVHVSGEISSQQAQISNAAAEHGDAQDNVSSPSSEVQPATPAQVSMPLTPFESSSSQLLYSVVGVSGGDFLNVHSGPGSTNGVTARLPNGYSGISIIGPPVMNDTTEWVDIEFGGGSGWVNRAYLKAD